MTASLRSMARQWWPVLFLFASLAFVYHYFSLQVGRLSLPSELRWPYLAGAIVLQLLYWLLNSWCWQSAVRWCTGVRLSLLRGLSQLAMSALGKYFPGKIWGMVARSSLLVQLGATKPQSIYVTLNEQFLILYSACLTSALAWCFVDRSAWSIALAAIAVVSVPALPALQKLAFALAARILPAVVPRQEEMALDSPKMVLLLAAYCIIWLLIGAIFCCVFYLMFPAEPALEVMARLTVANTVGIGIGFFAIFVPGGLGVREAVTSSLLASQLGLEQAILLCLTFRLWIVCSELLSGITLLIPQTGQAPPKSGKP